MRLRLLAQRDRLQLVVVDRLRIPPHGVERGPVELSAEAQLVPMREVATMGEIEPEDGVAGLQHRRVRRRVGLRARVRLHVRKLSAENLLGPVARQVLHHVGVLASAVVAPAGVPLGILVREHRARRFQHSFGHEVFAGDHLQPLVLAERFVIDGGGDFRIGLGEGERHAGIHTQNSRPSHPVQGSSRATAPRPACHPPRLLLHQESHQPGMRGALVVPRCPRQTAEGPAHPSRWS